MLPVEMILTNCFVWGACEGTVDCRLLLHYLWILLLRKGSWAPLLLPIPEGLDKQHQWHLAQCHTLCPNAALSSSLADSVTTAVAVPGCCDCPDSPHPNSPYSSSDSNAITSTCRQVFSQTARWMKGSTEYLSIFSIKLFFKKTCHIKLPTSTASLFPDKLRDKLIWKGLNSYLPVFRGKVKPLLLNWFSSGVKKAQILGLYLQFLAWEMLS